MPLEAPLMDMNGRHEWFPRVDHTRLPDNEQGIRIGQHLMSRDVIEARGLKFCSRTAIAQHLVGDTAVS